MKSIEKKIFSKLRILICLSLCLMAILLIPFYVKYKARNKIFSKIENIKKHDFAIVLGAAIIDNKVPGNYLKNRLDDAITLYKNEKIKKILISGDNGEAAHDEISVMNNYLIKNGIPQDNIFGDYAGFDTYSSIERADKIFEIKNTIIISQGFHLARAIYIANQKGIKATGYSTKQSFGKRRYFLREYFATIKSFFDCIINRKSKYYGSKINTKGKTNIKTEQL
jgi:SanA protein